MTIVSPAPTCSDSDIYGVMTMSEAAAALTTDCDEVKQLITERVLIARRAGGTYLVSKASVLRHRETLPKPRGFWHD